MKRGAKLLELAIGLSIAILGAFTPLALLGRSDALHLRGGSTPSERLAGQLWWLLASAFVVAVTFWLAYRLMSLRPCRVTGGPSVSVFLPLLAVGAWWALGFYGEFLLLAFVHSLGTTLLALPALRGWKVATGVGFWLSGAAMVFVANWAALFLE